MYGLTPIAAMLYLVTTDPGLEDIAAGEVSDRLPEAAVDIEPYGVQGQIRVETAVLDPLLELKTIHLVTEIRGEADAATLEAVTDALKTVDFPELRDAASFRVTSKLTGDRSLGKQELQRAAGALFYARHRTPVDLENPELNIRVDLHGSRLVAGIQRTADSLGNRIKRAKPLRSSLKPTIAASMLRLAGAHAGEGSLIDPMCGTGTIPIEAAAMNPRLQVLASDWDEQTVEVARATAANHSAAIDVQVADARALGDLHPRCFDYIVTNPPYGVRQAKRTSITRLYRSLLPSFARAIKEQGTIVLIVVKYRTFLSALQDSGLQLVDERVVDLGGIGARVYRMRPSQAGTG
jgi:putative N6-adenine-specific DNA methylase/tRNA (guanine6-N2)-methyltransferase